MGARAWLVVLAALAAGACAVSHEGDDGGCASPRPGDRCPRAVPAACSVPCAPAVGEGTVCPYPDQRCTCGTIGWYCEPLACPTDRYALGDRCDVPGTLGCAPHEGARTACPDPEREWIACNVRESDWAGFCPSDSPAPGAPCCITPLDRRRCEYPGRVLVCEDLHWRLE